ncbi:hypothetical protein [Aeromonas sp. s12]|uniref:hypothetical protein n=1 Tax=Aeromonas sp. s12 TaxID=3138482 RepID=UPI0034A2D2C0
MEDDLTWLARTEHRWPKDAVYVSRHENAVEWHYVELSFIGYGYFTRDQWLARRAELQNKPRWKDAPEWAEFLIQTLAGVWIWISHEPNGMDDNGDMYFHPDAESEKARDGEVIGDWRDTLERRPVDLSEPAGGVKERGTDGAEEVNAMAQRLLVALKSEPRSFDTDALAEMVELADAEIVKRDAKVCGGEGYLNNHWFERGELPPVGVECEFHGGARVGREWPDSLKDGAKVKVLCHYTPCMRPVAVFSFDIPGGKLTSQASEACFRPIRTERDLAVDEMMKDAGALQWETPKSIMLSLYDAGYRKQS